LREARLREARLREARLRDESQEHPWLFKVRPVAYFDANKVHFPMKVRIAQGVLSGKVAPLVSF